LTAGILIGYFGAVGERPAEEKTFSDIFQVRLGNENRLVICILSKSGTKCLQNKTGTVYWMDPALINLLFETFFTLQFS
jgi:hypothetical protein